MTGSIQDSLLPSFDFGPIFAHLFQGALSELLYCKIRIQNSLKWNSRTFQGLKNSPKLPGLFKTVRTLAK